MQARTGGERHHVGLLIGSNGKAPETIRGSSVGVNCERSVDARFRKVAQDTVRECSDPHRSDSPSQRRYAVESGSENRGPLLRVLVMHGRLGKRRRRQHYDRRERRQHHLQGYHLQPLDGASRLRDSGNRTPDKAFAARKKPSKITRLYGFNAHHSGRRRAVSRRRTASFSRCTTNRIKKVLTTVVTAYSFPGPNA